MIYAKGPKEIIPVFLKMDEISKLQSVGPCCHGHMLYEKWRTTPSSDPNFYKLADESKEYYSSIRKVKL